MAMTKENKIKVKLVFTGGKWDHYYQMWRKVYDLSGIAPCIPRDLGNSIDKSVKVFVDEEGDIGQGR